MGVKLAPLVNKHPTSIEELSNSVIGLDFSNVLFQFLSSIRQPDGTPLMDSHGNITSHLIGILTRFTNLMEKGIKLVVVIDGETPYLKASTHAERRLRKQEAHEKFTKAKQEEDTEAMHKYAKQLSFLNDKMIKEARELVEALGIPCIQSPQEADAQLSHLNRQGEISFVGSNDYDCLLFGANKLLLNLTLSQKRKLSSGKVINIQPEYIVLSELLSSLNISQEKLIALGILVGTDYHEGVHGIGPKKALKIVQQHKTLPEIFNAVNFEGDWKEVMNLFTSMKVTKKYSIKWSQPNEKQLRNLLVEKHDFSEERVSKAIQRLSQIKSASEQKGLSSWA